MTDGLPGSTSAAITSAFVYFAHLDQANAAVHCAAVRYSPLTFRLAEALDRRGHAPNLYADALLLQDVLNHIGAYPEDTGR